MHAVRLHAVLPIYFLATGIIVASIHFADGGRLCKLCSPLKLLFSHKNPFPLLVSIRVVIVMSILYSV